MDENIHFQTETELAEKEKKRLQGNKRNRKYNMNNNKKRTERKRELRARGKNFKHDPGKPIETLRNGTVRYKPQNSTFTEDIGKLICHLTLFTHSLPLIAAAIGKTEMTIINWKTKGASGYNPDFARDFEIAYRSSVEVLMSKMKLEVNDCSRDMFEDNNTGKTVHRPNNAAVQRSKLIRDKYYNMIRIRLGTIKRKSKLETVFKIVQYIDADHKDVKTISVATVNTA